MFVGKVYYDYQAVIAICRASPFLWPMAHALRFILSSPAAYRICKFWGRAGSLAKEILLLGLYGEEGMCYASNRWLFLVIYIAFYLPPLFTGIAMLERRKAYINDSTEEDVSQYSLLAR